MSIFICACVYSDIEVKDKHGNFPIHFATEADTVDDFKEMVVALGDR